MPRTPLLHYMEAIKIIFYYPTLTATVTILNLNYFFLLPFLAEPTKTNYISYGSNSDNNLETIY